MKFFNRLILPVALVMAAVSTQAMYHSRTPKGNSIGSVLTENKGIQAHTKQIKGLSFSPDGETLISVGADKKHRLIDVLKQEIIIKQDEQQAGASEGLMPKHVAFTSNKAAIAYSNQEITIYSHKMDGTDETLVYSFAGTTDARITVLHFISETELAVGLSDGSVKLLYVEPAFVNDEMPVIIARKNDEQCQVTALAYSACNERLFIAWEDGYIGQYDMHNMHNCAPVNAQELEKSSIIGMQTAKSGLLATIHEDQKVRLWELANSEWKKKTLAFSIPSKPLALSFSHDSAFLAVAHGMNVTIFDVKQGTIVQVITIVERSTIINKVLFSPTSYVLAVTTLKGKIWLYQDLASTAKETTEQEKWNKELAEVCAHKDADTRIIALDNFKKQITTIDNGRVKDYLLARVSEALVAAQVDNIKILPTLSLKRIALKALQSSDELSRCNDAIKAWAIDEIMKLEKEIQDLPVVKKSGFWSSNFNQLKQKLPFAKVYTHTMAYAQKLKTFAMAIASKPVHKQYMLTIIE